ncbi:hypothetical protein NIIg97_gp34 [Geobacillus phage vB_GthS_NIIg9.7]|nr:hypothetical protein NIIg97_gp34 [Geobacillus phage vB_GthS_NIIg9.7]UYL94231.1 hypothetical protein PT91_gp35 [Geobacillus phage vB_GthS_PT9.1]
MNDKERLQRIKEDVSFWEYCLKNTHWCELVSHDIEKIKWLIERVEQLQQEQKRLKNQIYETVEEKFLLEKQFQRAQAKAERYEKALKEIVEWSGIASREYRIATKALEGKENE